MFLRNSVLYLALGFLLGNVLFSDREEKSESFGYSASQLWELSPPPDAYADVYQQAEECVDTYLLRGVEGAKRDVTFEDISWYAAASIVRDYDDAPMAGVFIEQHNQILLSFKYLGQMEVVYHEILHFLLYPVGHGQGIFWLCDPVKTPSW